jgi:ribosome-associated protein
VANQKKKPTAKAKKKVKKSAAKKPSVKKAPVKKSVAKKPVAKKVVVKTKRPDGLPEKMLAAALKVLDERKAEEIVVVSLTGRSSIADYMILASGRAGRQIAAIADHLREAFSKLGIRGVRVEGQSDAVWVLVDAGDIIIHLFLPEVRKYYDLDSLWSKKASKK